jgi:TRAP-type C4-dicarboxylate transport system permease large subunit
VRTRAQDVVRPYLRCVVVLLVTLALLIARPTLTLWLPKHDELA